MSETDDREQDHLTHHGSHGEGPPCPQCGGALVPGLWRCGRCGFS
jgi:hypothetical protein